MSEKEKPKQDDGKASIVDVLVSKFGYDGDSALKVALEVTSAMKTVREEHYKTYLNRRVVVKVEGLSVECIVGDVKLTDEGVAYQVKPIAGSGNIWVKRFASVL